MPSSTPDERTPEEQQALAAAERRGSPFVLYRDGQGRQQLYPLPESGGAISIGRGLWMDIPLAWDEQVSRLHATFERIGDDWTVVDEGLSRNGSFLNGERVEGRRRLSNGDQLRFGATTVSVRIPDRPDAGATVVADTPPSDGE